MNLSLKLRSRGSLLIAAKLGEAYIQIAVWSGPFPKKKTNLKLNKKDPKIKRGK
jgi:hypothetical protein